MLSFSAGVSTTFAGASLRTAPLSRALPVQMGLSWTEYDGAKWDPLKLAKTPEKFEKLRYVELKHGRIAMLAFLGHAAAAGAHLPGKLAGDLAFADMPKTGFAALAATPPLGLLQMFLFVGFLELKVCKDVTGTGEFPGDFRNGVDNGAWDSFTPQQKLEKRSKELNNGRAAMMGILGLMVHENLAGPAYVANEYFGLPAPF